MRNKQNKIEYDNTYIKNKFDRLSFVMPKGTKEEIKAYSQAKGISSSEWMREAIQEKMDRQDKTFVEPVTREKIDEE